MENIPLAPYVSIYRLCEGLSQKQVSQNISAALSIASEYLKDPLPESIRECYQLCTLTYALRQIHLPVDHKSLFIAKRRLIFDEFFIFALGLSISHKERKKETAAPCSDLCIDRFIEKLPYRLTDGQIKTIEEIKRDMSSNTPMSRIIIGDVGCGKTVCAAAAMYIAVINGKQAALMAPTEILAIQHYNSLKELFSSLGIKCGLLTGSTPVSEKKKTYDALSTTDKKNRLDIIIGTHALLSDGVKIADAGLVITDEQHRFGVNQRSLLSQKNNRPHTLVMSATPIPRSLALVLYGDLDLSKIDSMPPGRQRVDTFLVDEGYRSRLNAFIEKNIEDGGQVYIVCPSIDEKDIDDDEIALSEISLSLSAKKNNKKPPLKAAIKYAQDLSKHFPEYRIAFIHGKMSSHDKDSIMTDFAEGKIKILVSTTVIEVGVNVPNACLMIVENAERFGLSALHQLRGRVGRGSRRSYCVLVAGDSLSALTDTARLRLEAMCKTYNGFEIAEEDLRLRGPGDFLAGSAENADIRQSGNIKFRLADMCEDSELMKHAFTAAKELAADDPELNGHPLLKDEIKHMFTIKADILN